MKLDFDVVVIGAGVAGMTAAMYLKRGNYDVAIVERSTPGGLMNITSVIENYPGIDTITGPDLAFKMFEQVNGLGIPLINGDVIEVVSENYKIVKLADKDITCKAVIIATGRDPRKLPNDRGLSGKGISYCALCDGALYKNQDVAIVGGGNSALEESLYLSKICSKVYLLIRSDKITGDSILVDEVTACSNIEVLFNTQIKDFNEENGRLASVVIDKASNIENLDVSAVFVFIGYKPAAEEFASLGILDDKGYILADDMRRTSVDKIYAAGDIVYKQAFQIVTAASDGAIAATSCMRDLGK